MDNFVEYIITKLPGIAGSAGALLWIPGTWLRKLALFILGIVVCEYVSTDFMSFTGLSLQATGLIIGLFSMTAADWVFRGWSELSLGAIVNEWVRHKLGMDKK